MKVLCIRTDNPTAELRLYKDDRLVASMQWEAHRLLAETIHRKIDELLTDASVNLNDITKVVVYEGPGSFTGLRIGMSVANSLAYGLGIPIVAARGEGWAENASLEPGSYAPLQPVYGQDPHITQQKK